jgi:hypothetical protein
VEDLHLDPLDDAPDVSPRGALALTVIAWILAAAAVLPTGLSFVLGPLGMGCGLVAHLKGRRAGFVAAAVAAVTTVVGLSIQSFLDPF